MALTGARLLEVPPVVQVMLVELMGVGMVVEVVQGLLLLELVVLLALVVLVLVVLVRLLYADFFINYNRVE